MKRAQGRFLLLGIALVTLLRGSGYAAVTGADAGLSDVVVVTEDCADEMPGCDAVSAFDATTAGAIYRGRTHVSPGRLAASWNLSAVLASPSNGVADQSDVTNREPWLYVARSVNAGRDGWSSGTLTGANFATFGGVAVLDAGSEFLAATASGKPNTRGGLLLRPLPPFHVRRYALPVVVSGIHPVGPATGEFSVESLVVQILLSPDGMLAHLVTDSSHVHTIDPHTMTETAARIEVAPFLGPRNRFFDAPVNKMHATLSPDGRFMVANRGESGELNVVDLTDRTSHTVPSSPDIGTIGGVAFNHARGRESLLAIHAVDKVVLYRFVPAGPLVEMVRLAIPAPPVKFPPNPNTVDSQGPWYALAWSADGSRLIAASDIGPAEFAVIAVGDDGYSLSLVGSLEACGGCAFNYPNDIVTANALPRPPAPSATPTVTLSPTTTNTPFPPPTDAETVTPTATATTICPPRPAHLPMVLREQCVAGQQHTDVAMVIDASTSMRDEYTSTGRRKLDAAREAVALFVSQLDLAGGDQAAIVQFNADAAVLSPLTHDRAMLERALSTIQVARQTRIQAGIHLAREELTSARHRPVNNRAMVVLTDGANNPEPVAEAEREAALARADGIRVFTVGLGVEVEADALARMATSAADYFYAPDGEDLAAIYRRIAYAIPCPPESFWGGR